MKFVQRPSFSEEEIDDQGSWAISYGDMITLLLAFFVLFFTVNPDRDSQKTMNHSLVKHLKDAERDLASESYKADLNLGPEENERGIEEKLVEDWGARVHKIGDRIIVEFPGKSFFKLGYIEPNDEGQEILKKFVKVFLPYSGHYTLGIRAYTDSRKVVSTNLKYKDNLELSALRAVATMRVLQNHGIPLHHMRLGGYGELILTHEELLRVQPTHTADAYSLARTVVLVIEPLPQPKKPGGSHVDA